jgi:DNA-directed RNA polymerase subunit RPC12/RpoP
MTIIPWKCLRCGREYEITVREPSTCEDGIELCGCGHRIIAWGKDVEYVATLIREPPIEEAFD